VLSIAHLKLNIVNLSILVRHVIADFGFANTIPKAHQKNFPDQRHLEKSFGVRCSAPGASIVDFLSMASA
jgi:hypothetical protein